VNRTIENEFYEFVSPTPGAVDNLKPNGRGGFLAGVVIPSFEGEANVFLDYLLPYSTLRMVLTKILYISRYSLK